MLAKQSSVSAVIGHPVKVAEVPVHIVDLKNKQKINFEGIF